MGLFVSLLFFYLFLFWSIPDISVTIQESDFSEPESKYPPSLVKPAGSRFYTNWLLLGCRVWLQHPRKFNSELPSWVPFYDGILISVFAKSLSSPCCIHPHPPPPLLSALRAWPIWAHRWDGRDSAFWLGSASRVLNLRSEVAVGWHLVWLLWPLAVKWSWQSVSLIAFLKLACSTWPSCSMF